MATRTTNRTILKILICTLILHATSSKSTKTLSRPVHEVINEQSRIDENIRTTKGPGAIPYGNPLAGKQNARLHAQNQQAMFNAEKIRQHRAQLQRWTKAPLQIDSYMKAYHESHENHHLALEQQQTRTTAFVDATTPVTSAPIKLTTKARPDAKRGKHPDLIKITKADAMKAEKNRNHRSHGSIDFRHKFSPKRYQTVYISPGTTYDQGVTIKPHGIVGMAPVNQVANEETKLYTEAIPSSNQFIYPKQYGQMQSYQSAQDIETLNTLLKKEPQEQVSELNSLIQSTKEQNINEGTIDNTPIDLYFYLKGQPQAQALAHYEPSKYAQINPTYASAYMPEKFIVKDHIPIMEEVDDIADPNIKTKVTPYGTQQIPIQQPQIHQIPVQQIPIQQIPVQQNNAETTTVKSNNYYKVEVASQTITSGYKVPYQTVVKQQTEQYFDDNEARYAAFQYAHPTLSYANEPEDYNKKYLHHNAQHIGLQHQNVDGTSVPAYGETDLHYAANYEFGYRVHDSHSGNDFGHHETKNGENTNGGYHVLLPDGRVQNVKYSAGPEGFHADISYDHLHYKH